MSVAFNRQGANATVTVTVNVAQMNLGNYTQTQQKKMVAELCIEEVTLAITALEKTDAVIDSEFDGKVNGINSERNRIKQARPTGNL